MLATIDAAIRASGEEKVSGVARAMRMISEFLLKERYEHAMQPDGRVRVDIPGACAIFIAMMDEDDYSYLCEVVTPEGVLSGGFTVFGDAAADRLDGLFV